jgi:folate-binding protein YgfZ
MQNEPDLSPPQEAGHEQDRTGSGVPPSPLLAVPGAVPADGPDAGVAAHYGDPFAEQRALSGALGVVDRSHRGVVRIAGQDRLSWLHSLTTAALEKLAPGSTAEALVLSPSGHVEFHLTLTDDGSAIWAHVEPGTAGPLVEFLKSMQFLLRVEPADVTSGYAVLTIMGRSEADVRAAAAMTKPAAATERAGETFIMDVIIERERLAEAAAGLRANGAVLGGMWAYEALRIAAGRPRLGLDTDHRTIPHEVGWIGTAVQLDKGCYRGQETVARVHNLGHPPRRLVLLHLDGSEDRLPEHGDPVTLGQPGGTTPRNPPQDRQPTEESGAIGFVGSAARHFELGPVALALVRRTVPVQATLLAAGVPAAQEVVVPPDAGANVKITLGRRGSLLARARE